MQRGMLKRAGAVSVAVMAAASLTAASPAQAASCTVRIDLPSTVSIDRPFKEVRAVLRTGCDVLEYTSTYLYGPDGMDDVFIWDPAAHGGVEYWDVYDWTTPGTYKTRDGRAYTYDYDDATVIEDSVRVKYASRTSVKAARSKKTVTVTASAKRYVPSADAFRAYNTRARIEQKTKRGWVVKKTVALGADGRASVRFHSPAKKQWRVRILETSQVWGHVSGVTTR